MLAEIERQLAIESRAEVGPRRGGGGAGGGAFAAIENQPLTVMSPSPSLCKTRLSTSRTCLCVTLCSCLPRGAAAHAESAEHLLARIPPSSSPPPPPPPSFSDKLKAKCRRQELRARAWPELPPPPHTHVCARAHAHTPQLWGLPKDPCENFDMRGTRARRSTQRVARARGTLPIASHLQGPLP